MSQTPQLKPTVDTGTFRRYVPFGDGREVTATRGAERTPLQAFLRAERRVTLRDGRSLPVKRYEEVLSPPPLMPGQDPLPPEAAASYHPTFEVVDLSSEQLCFPRSPHGFTMAEVDALVEAFAARPGDAGGGTDAP